jgi:carbonic anhydrase/acetyltransferase-like protein (isoleucine patch superfamily)
MVIGDVEIGPESNVWFYSILRGDPNYIRIVKSLWKSSVPP